jgi:hypothetical protein
MNHVKEPGFFIRVADGCPDLSPAVVAGRFCDQARVKEDFARPLKRNAMFLKIPDIFAFIPSKVQPFEYIIPFQRQPPAHL